MYLPLFVVVLCLVFVMHCFCVLSSLTIILASKRELVALL